MITVNGKARKWERYPGHQILYLEELHTIPFTVTLKEDGKWYTNYGNQRYHRTCKTAKQYVERLIKEWARRVK